MYYVYVDWTLEDVPRAFYVGKGSGSRIYKTRRNWNHRRVRRTFGYRREIVFRTENEDEAFLKEKQLICEFHTFVDDVEADDIACNFTDGGSGGRTPSKHTRMLLSEANRRRKGEKRSFEACKRISSAIQKSIREKGRNKLSSTHRRHISSGLKGHKVSNETKEKIRVATQKSWNDPDVRKKRSKRSKSSKVSVQCQFCGKQHLVFVSRINSGRGKYCSSECYKNARIQP